MDWFILTDRFYHFLLVALTTLEFVSPIDSDYERAKGKLNYKKFKLSLKHRILLDFKKHQLMYDKFNLVVFL